MDFRGNARFRVERQIGSGGMGVVYEAFDTERGAKVALKTLRSLDASSLLRFKAEFRSLADLHHDNLVRFDELHADGDRYFFTMELVHGVDFLSYVRPGITTDSLTSSAAIPAADTLPAVSSARGSVTGSGRPGVLDEARLRLVLGQLAHGLAALHAAGKVHRDVKPQNVLVDPHGGSGGDLRVVLVDFGLATDAGAAESAAEGVAGTVAYMAPEQASGSGVGPAADWYAVGAMLYEALTGQVPFFGSAYEVLTTKRTASPPRPRDVAPEAPEDLAVLCTDLLQSEPARRPTDEEVLRRLGGPPARGSLMPPPAGGPGGPRFVGRRRELERLQRAYEQARRGAAVTVYVDGESGLGKTALVRHFVAQMARADPDVVVLTGRCYERESVPYKAVDGVVDALGRFLLGSRRADVDSILSASAADRLTRAFPVLGRVRATKGASGERLPETSPSSAFDPIERRARVFGAMREVVHALAESRLVVMVVDDLQWADADSLLLLREVMRAPPAAILLLATVRTGHKASATRSGPPASLPPSRLNVGSSAMPGEVFALHLEPLGEAESRALAEMLIERSQGSTRVSVPESAADSIVREAAGHPLFIDELVRHAWIDGDARQKRRPPLRLEDALWARIRAAEEVERALLEVLAIARGPLALDTAARACGLESPAALDEVIAKLRFERLVRTTRAAGRTAPAPSVETYHDRVRRAVLAHLETPERELHARIAAALEATADADLEALAEHCRGAGELEKASTYALGAANAAAEKVAFDRAARLYEWAIAMRPEAATKEVLVSLAGALGSAGRGPAAADAYLRAAARSGEADEARELRRLAAHYLLTTGHVREGMDVMNDVLCALDLQVARSPRLARAWLVARRTRLHLRGLEFVPRPPDPSRGARRELERVDACLTASAGLAHVAPSRGAELQARGLLLALAAGDPTRVVRALVHEATYAAHAGDDARGRWSALLDRARDVARSARDPSLLPLVLAGEGVALYLSGYWLGARTRCEDALRGLRESAPASAWELDAAALYSLHALCKLGHLAAVRAALPDRLADAEARGDRFAEVHLRSGELNMVWLAAGDADSARRELEAVALDEGSFGLPELQELVARTRVDLYVGDAARAHQRLTERQPALERSELLGAQHHRITLVGLRARAALAMARGPGASRRWLDDAARCTNQLARTGAAWGLADAALLRGCMSQALGDPRRAAVSFDQAARDYAACDMSLHAAVARLRLGKLVGGDDGRGAVARARAWMQGEGVADPDAFAALVAP